MSSVVSSTSAAPSRPFSFEVPDEAEVCLQPSWEELGAGRPPRRVVSSEAFRDKRLAAVTPASRLAVRPLPEMVSSGVTAVDALTGGLPRGCLTELCGPPSSGRTTLLLGALAASTRRGEFCALVDATDSLDPQSAAAAGIALDRLLWVRCGGISPQKSVEQLLRVADLLLESGGFGMIALDLGDVPPQTARCIPLTTWFRFRRAVEHTPTVLLAIERQSIAGSCSSLLIKLGSKTLRREFADSKSPSPSPPSPSHAQLLMDVEITAELVRSRLERKPVRSAEVVFSSPTAWA